MTKEEGMKWATDCNNSRSGVFCPIIKDYCRLDCEFYATARSIEKKQRKYDGSGEIEATGEYLQKGGYCDFKTECNCGN